VKMTRILGLKFGRWTVLEYAGKDKNSADLYKCKCSCGKIKKVRIASLKKGNSQSCGCILSSDLTGKKFGRLYVLGRCGTSKGRKILYRCRCDCGKIVKRQSTNLTNSETPSCGCANKDINQKTGELRRYDLRGVVFGELTVVKENGRDSKGEVYWYCVCSCGGEKIIRGRFLRNGKAKTHCGCKNPVPKAKPVKIKKKPRDDEAFAKDIWCGWVKGGVSLRDTAAAIGLKRGCQITPLLMEHIPGYREASEERRAKSKWARSLERHSKKSKLFRLEKELQEHCVELLKRRGVFVVENDRDTTGYEIDIKTNDCCYELKVTTVKKDVYRAIGQLKINAKLSGLKPVLVIPSDTTIHEDLYLLVKDEGIVVVNETNM